MMSLDIDQVGYYDNRKATITYHTHYRFAFQIDSADLTSELIKST